MRPFGYHIPGGQHLGTSLKAAVDLGFTAAQIFLGPPGRAAVSNIPLPEFRLFLDVKRSTGIPVFVHAPYVLHVFARPENKHKNHHTLKKFYDTACNLECNGLVVHMGGTKWYDHGSDGNVYSTEAVDFLNVLDARGKKCTVLLENCANGNAMSGNLRDICNLLTYLKQSGYSVGLCLDTCHAWAWGYDYRDANQLAVVTSEMVSQHLKLIHLNSAPIQVVCGGKYDRHSSLDSGCIPKSSFESILRSFPEIPAIAERDDVNSVYSDLHFVRYIDENGVSNDARDSQTESI